MALESRNEALRALDALAPRAEDDDGVMRDLLRLNALVLDARESLLALPLLPVVDGALRVVQLEVDSHHLLAVEVAARGVVLNKLALGNNHVLRDALILLLCALRARG
eukprot:3732067-Pyramimonas_sp.AAC.1